MVSDFSRLQKFDSEKLIQASKSATLFLGP